MKTLFTALLLLVTLTGYSQKTKKIDVAKVTYYGIEWCYIIGIVSFDESNTPTDTLYCLFGRDARYQQLIQYIKIKSGSLKEINDFLKHCENIMNTEDVGIQITYDGNFLQIEKSMGIKYVDIYGLGSDSDGYTGFGKAQFSKIFTSINSYAGKNKIVL